MKSRNVEKDIKALEVKAEPPQLTLGEALVSVRNGYAALYGDFQPLIVAATELQATIKTKDGIIAKLQARVTELEERLADAAEEIQGEDA